MKVIFTHGGAGLRISSQEQKEGVRIAAEKGMDVLRAGGETRDAAVAAVLHMEDSGFFNAGVGSVLRFDPSSGLFRIQMDAAFATSRGLRAAVTGVEGVRNPIRITLAVPSKNAVIISGDGATQLAKELGLSPHPGPSSFAIGRFLELLRGMSDGEFAEMAPGWTREDLARILDQLSKNGGNRSALSSGEDCDTVGAIALDDRSEFALAASTGGIGRMYTGRVGDLTEQGAGWERGPLGAVLATGQGEKILTLRGSAMVYRRIEEGLSPQQACDEGVRMFGQDDPETSIGFIALTIRGEVGTASNRDMPFHVIREQ